MAQEALNIVNKINTNYQESVLSLKTTYQLYDGEIKNSNLIDSYQGIIYKNGIKKYTKLKDMELVQSESYNILVNHTLKSIIVTGSYKGIEEDNLVTVDGGIQNLLKLCKEVKSSSGRLTFIEPKGSQYNKVVVEYNKSFLITRLIMYNKQELNTNNNKSIKQPIYVIKMEYLPKGNYNHYFDYSRFLIKKNNRYLLNKDYQSYTLNQKGL